MREYKNKYKMGYISIAIVCIVMITLGALFNVEKNEEIIDKKADKEVKTVSASTGCSVNATIYNNDSYTGNGVNLTSTGGRITGWEHDTSGYLQVEVNVNPDDGNGHIVEIELSKEMYVYTTDIEYVPVGFKSVSFTPNNERIPVNGGMDYYRINEHSGKLTYELEDDISTATIELELYYDTALWDHKVASSIAPEGVDPIKVGIKHKGSASYIEQVKISSISAGSASYTEVNYWYEREEGYEYANNKTQHLWLWFYRDTYLNHFYYKNVVIDIDLPYYTYKGRKYYLEPKMDEIYFYYEDNYGTGSYYNVQKVGEGKVRFTIDVLDIWGEDDAIGIQLTLPSNMPISQMMAEGLNFIKFDNGRITATGTGNSGTTGVVFIDSAYGGQMYQLEDAESVYLESEYKDVYKDTSRRAAMSFGTAWVGNDGCEESCEKTIKFTFPSELLVTSVVLLSDRTSQYLDLEYELMDENGNQIYFDNRGSIVPRGTLGATTKCVISVENWWYGEYGKRNNLYTQFSRQELPEQHRHYFFKSLEYTIDSLPEYSSQWADCDNDSKGVFNIFGYVSERAKVDELYYTNITITSPAETGIEPLDGNIMTYVTDEIKTSVYGEIGLDNGNTYKAGDDISFTGWVGGNDCATYATTNIVEDISLGLYLPTGMSLDKDSINICNYDTRENIAVKVVTCLESTEDYELWLIEIPDELYFGYYREELGDIKDKWGIEFKFTIKTDIDMESMNIYKSDLFGFTVENGEIAYSPHGYSYSEDKFDINRNGRTDDNIGTIANWNNEMFSIKGTDEKLKHVESLSIEGQGYVEDGKAIIKNQEDKVTYSIAVSRREIGTLEDYAHYIAIPKESSVRDAFLVQSDAELGFDFNLAGEVTFSGNAIFEARYAVEENMDFNKAKDLAANKWYTYSQVISNYSLEDVTMVKIVLKNGQSVSNDFNTTINVPMVSSNAKNETIQGDMNIWRSRAYYSFRYGARRVAGYTRTGIVRAEIGFDPVPDAPSIIEDMIYKDTSQAKNTAHDKVKNGNKNIKEGFRGFSNKNSKKTSENMSNKVGADYSNNIKQSTRHNNQEKVYAKTSSAGSIMDIVKWLCIFANIVIGLFIGYKRYKNIS